MKTRHIIVMTMALACAMQAEGQSLWERFYNGWLVKPRNVDSSYIYQQSMGFTPSLTSNFSRQRVQMTTSVLIEGMPEIDDEGLIVYDEFGNEKVMDLLITVIDKMEEQLSRRVGAILGLGRLGAGWSFGLAPDSSQQSSTFLFSFRGNKWGLNINYLGFSQKVEERVQWTPGTFAAESVDTIASGNRMHRMVLDGYYVFNTRRFAYPPGIAGNMVQLRSAGSWMLAGRFVQSELSMADKAAIGRFGMSQFSLGCGYSYTWVPWSRQPRPDGKGMRTFFLNVTLIPMLTVYNHMSIEPYEALEDWLGLGREGAFCWPTPNVLTNATVGFSWNRFYLGAQFNYNVFHFNTRNAISNGKLHSEGIDVMGVLYEWNLGLKFQACF